VTWYSTGSWGALSTLPGSIQPPSNST
jgi:hypothetical protein